MKRYAGDSYVACNPRTSLQNRAAKARALLCAMALGLASITGAQPSQSFMLDTTCVPGRDYNAAWATGSAFGDSMGLVVWAGGGVAGIEGCRVRGDMSVIDSICLDISGPGRYACHPPPG